MDACPPDRDVMTLRTASLSSPRHNRLIDTASRSTAQSARLVASQAVLGFAWTAVSLFLGFATKVLLTRKLPAADLGIILAAQAFASLVLVVAELGLPDAVVRYVGAEASTEAAPRRTVYAAVRIVSVSGVLTAALVLAALFVWSDVLMAPGALPATAILILGLPLFAVGNVLGAAYRGINRLATKLVAIDVLRPGIVAIVLLASPAALFGDATYVAGLYVVGALIVLAGLWVLFNRDSQWRNIGATSSSDLLQFGVPMAGTAMLSGPLVNGLLPMMLAASTGSSAVAFYGIALALQGLAGLPLGIFEQVLVPLWARMAARDTAEDLARSYQQYTNICFAFATGVGVVIIANDRAILSALFGEGYAAASTPLRYAVVATLFAAWAGPNEAMLRSVAAPRSIFVARLITAALGTASALALIPRYGLTGGVLSFAFAVVVLNVAYGIALYRTRRIHPFTWRHSITTIAASAAVLAATALQGSYPVAGWFTAHLLALVIVAANADLRSTFGAVRSMVVALR
jgi:stage V sporulation protein B